MSTILPTSYEDSPMGFTPFPMDEVAATVVPPAVAATPTNALDCFSSKVSRAKATEGKAGMAGVTGPVRGSTAGTGLRVGVADAVQPATSEFMDVTAGRVPATNSQFWPRPLSKGSGSGFSVLQIVAETEQRWSSGKPVQAQRGLVKAGDHNDRQDAARHKQQIPSREPAKGYDPDQNATGGVVIPSMAAEQSGESEAGEIDAAGAWASQSLALRALAEPAAVKVGCGQAPESIFSSDDGLGIHESGSIMQGGSDATTALSGRAEDSAKCPAAIGPSSCSSAESRRSTAPTQPRISASGYPASSRFGQTGAGVAPGLQEISSPH